MDGDGDEDDDDDNDDGDGNGDNKWINDATYDMVLTVTVMMVIYDADGDNKWMIDDDDDDDDDDGEHTLVVNDMQSKSYFIKQWMKDVVDDSIWFDYFILQQSVNVLFYSSPASVSNNQTGNQVLLQLNAMQYSLFFDQIRV